MFAQAFAMIDQDRDGIIGADDLAAIYQQVGRYFVHHSTYRLPV